MVDEQRLPRGQPLGTVKVTDAVTNQPDIYSPVENLSSPAVNLPFEPGVTIGAIESSSGYTAGQTVEAYVSCSSLSSGGGTTVNDQSTFITFNTDNATYSSTGTAPAGPQTPTVTLAAQPTTVQVGASVTLTANVSVGSTAVTTGTVTFLENGSAINATGAPVTNGVATINTTFTSAGSETLTAEYNSANTTTINNGTSAPVTETVSATNPNSIGELITVTVAPTGTFTFSGTAGATVPLTLTGSAATGTLVPVTVTDSRTGLAPQSSPTSLAAASAATRAGRSSARRPTLPTRPRTRPATSRATSSGGPPSPLRVTTTRARP